METQYSISGLFDNYNDYLNSYIWKEKRDFLIKKVGYCTRCGRRKRLVVHHNTYANIGNEREQDLDVVCFDCHNRIHRRMRKMERPYLSQKRKEMLASMPYISNEVSKSKDGRFVIHKTIFTTIYNVEYFQKVLDNGKDQEQKDAATDEKFW